MPEVDLAEEWWLEVGQYTDQDRYLYPKDVIKEAHRAGFELGLTLGKSESNR